VTKLPLVSGEQVIKALCEDGFIVIRQKGSHVRMKKTTFGGWAINVTVPLHDVLDRGTLKSIIKTVGLSVDEFIELL